MEGHKDGAKAARLRTQFEQAQNALADGLDALSDLAAAQGGIDESAILAAYGRASRNPWTPAGTDHVLLSLDGLMRYVPVVALHDTQGWLQGRRDYVTFTTASRDLLLDDETLENLSVEAFGASRGGTGFTPLTFVQQGVQQIAGDQGQLAGRTWLDDGFDDQTVSRGLQSGAPVVHIATHFHQTDREDSSAKLLGNGETFSVATLKANARRGNFDLADVQLMILSACQTALAKGGELESFAATLQREGVRSVIATLWPVADRSTSDFMVGYYKELKQGKSRARALRTMQQRIAGSERTSETDSLRAGVALQTAKKERDCYRGYSIHSTGPGSSLSANGAEHTYKTMQPLRRDQPNAKLVQMLIDKPEAAATTQAAQLYRPGEHPLFAARLKSDQRRIDAVSLPLMARM